MRRLTKRRAPGLRRSIALCTSLALLCSLAHAAENEEDEKLFTRYVHLLHYKQYAQAWELVLEMRRTGSRYAARSLDEWLMERESAEKVKLRDDWIEKGAHAGDADAQFLLGMRLLQSMDPEAKKNDPAQRKILVAGLRWLIRAADQGHEHALFYVANMSQSGLRSLGLSSRHAREK